MNIRRRNAVVVAVTIGSLLLVACSQPSRSVNDPKCVAFRKAASVYTDKVTKTRSARRTAENAAIGKSASSPEAADVKRTTDAWLKSKQDLELFYAADKSGCVSH